jgi:cellulose synthase/poly-beta-1,6-N-acetylglucosamine synthase-like glycosyltransferase
MIGQLFDADHRAPDDLLKRVTPAGDLNTEVDVCA